MKKQVFKQNNILRGAGLVVALFLMVSGITGIARAEFGDVIWYETYNFSASDDIDQYECYDMAQTDDGGYIFAGKVDYENDGDYYKAMLLKVDANRDTVWFRTFGPNDGYKYTGYQVVSASDGGYILAGSGNYYDNSSDPYASHGVSFIKVDANGDTIWTRWYGDEHTRYTPMEAFATADGGYVMFGYTVGDDSEWGCEWGFGVKADADGNEVWFQNYDSPDDTHNYFMIKEAEATDDGGFFLCGVSKYVDEETYTLYNYGVIAKVDADGEVEWNNICGRTNSVFNDICLTSDGGYFCHGQYWGEEGTGGNACATVMKYNSSFEEEFYHYTNFGDNGFSYISSYGREALELPDGRGYVTVGYQLFLSQIFEDPTDMGGAYNLNPMLQYVNTDGSNYSYRIYKEEFADLYNQWGALAVEIWEAQLTPENNLLIAGQVFSQGFDYQWDEDDRGAVFIAELGEVVSVDEDNTGGLPEQLSLLQNYPNPFNATTSIRFSLNTSDVVTLSVYDILGRQVNTLYSGSLSAGTHNITWNGTDESGDVVSSGMYFYRLETSDNVSTKQMLLLK